MDTFELTSVFFFYFSYYYARDVTYGFRGAVPSIMLSSPALRAGCYLCGLHQEHHAALSSPALRARCYTMANPRKSAQTPFISRATRGMLRLINESKNILRILSSPALRASCYRCIFWITWFRLHFHFSRFARVVTSIHAPHARSDYLSFLALRASCYDRGRPGRARIILSFLALRASCYSLHGKCYIYTLSEQRFANLPEMSFYGFKTPRQY